jgi:hypothetical protein
VGIKENWSEGIYITNGVKMDLKVPTASPWSGEYTGVKIMVISQLQHLLFITIRVTRSLKKIAQFLEM